MGGQFNERGKGNKSTENRARAPFSGDEIDLRELFSAIWQGRFLILVITCLFVAVAVLYALNQPNIYKAQALVAPASSNSNGGLSAMARQFGGLASLAGINIGGGSGDDKTKLAIEVMQSRQFITRFIQNNELLVPLMAAKEWDQITNELILDPELYDQETKQWTRKVKPPVTPEPSMWEANKAFKKVFSVSQAKDSGLITVAIDSLSPELAQEWVSLLIKEINLEMKSKDLEEARSSIAYLNSQLENTEVTQMQNVFYQLIEEQTKTIMLSEVRDEYVFTTVDPAVVPEEKTAPKRIVIVLLASITGFVLALILVFIRVLLAK